MMNQSSSSMKDSSQNNSPINKVIHAILFFYFVVTIQNALSNKHFIEISVKQITHIDR